jgi:hypothetical protein
MTPGKQLQTFWPRVLSELIRRVSAEPINVMSLPGRSSWSRFPYAGCDDINGAEASITNS